MPKKINSDPITNEEREAIRVYNQKLKWIKHAEEQPNLSDNMQKQVDNFYKITAQQHVKNIMRTMDILKQLEDQSESEEELKQIKHFSDSIKK